MDDHTQVGPQAWRQMPLLYEPSLWPHLSVLWMIRSSLPSTLLHGAARVRDKCFCAILSLQHTVDYSKEHLGLKFFNRIAFLKSPLFSPWYGVYLFLFLFTLLLEQGWSWEEVA